MFVQNMGYTYNITCMPKKRNSKWEKFSALSMLPVRFKNIVLCICRSFLDLGAGLSVGLSGLAAGFAIGIVGDAGVRGSAQQPRLFVGMILILIFAEVLGLYGLIVALILHTKS